MRKRNLNSKQIVQLIYDKQLLVSHLKAETSERNELITITIAGSLLLTLCFILATEILSKTGSL